MSSQNHIIKKQVIELYMNGKEEAPALQEEFKKIYYEKLEPLLEKYFDGFSHPEIISRLDKLEINVNILDSENLEEDFLEKLEEQLIIELEKNVAPLFDLEQFEDVEKRKTGSSIDLLNQFIYKGTLPWWADKNDKKIVEKTIKTLSEDSPDQLKNSFIRAFMHEPYQRRIIHSLSEDTLLLIISTIDTEWHSFIKWLNRSLNITFSTADIFSSVSKNKLKLEKWRGIYFSLLRGNKADGRETKYLEELLLHIATGLNLRYDEMLRSIEKVNGLHSDRYEIGSSLFDLHKKRKAAGSLKESLDRLSEALSAPLKQKTGDYILSLLQDILSSLTESKPTPELLHLATRLLKKLQKEKRDEAALSLANKIKTYIKGIQSEENNNPDPAKPFDDLEEIYVNNAGLVLIWPFLIPFFEELDFIKDKDFIDEHTRNRAILLLQYFVDTSVESQEFLLPINKILCGLELEKPVELSFQITGKEKEEAENMLSAAIHNWPVLKDISVDGFRQAYLQREGALSIRDGSWLLRVERKGYDIIVDQIPWTFKMIKLPWMKNILIVEW